jgi:hypothetical protein
VSAAVPVRHGASNDEELETAEEELLSDEDDFA